MKLLVTFALFALSSAAAYAQVSVKDAWVRATVPQQKATGAYMHLTAARSVRLVEVRSPAAGVVELHETSMVNNMMRMRPVATLDLPAGKAIELKPGGHHIMLMNLKGPIQEGASVPLTLVLEGADGKRESVEVKAAVRPLTEHAGGHKAH